MLGLDWKLVFWKLLLSLPVLLWVLQTFSRFLMHSPNLQTLP